MSRTVVNDTLFTQLDDTETRLKRLEAAQNLLGRTLLTALPTLPMDGQEILFLADDANGVIWRLRYRSTSASAYKWEYLGGASLASESAATIAATTSGTAYVSQAFAGSAMTLPLAGDYDIQWSSVIANTLNDIGDFRIVPGLNGTPITLGSSFINATWFNQHHGRAILRSAPVASVLDLRYLSAATSIAFNSFERHVFATPVRVG